MPTNTSRLALAEPLGADASSELRIAITGHATTLDSAVTITEGTLVTRPSGSYYGQAYYATDAGPAGRWYFYNGSTWQTALVAGAWTNLTLASGVGTTVGYYSPQARVEGDLVRLRGVVTNTSGGTIAGGNNVVQLPAGMAPASSVAFGAVLGAGAASGVLLQVGASSTVVQLASSSPSWPSGDVLGLDGLTFTLI